MLGCTGSLILGLPLTGLFPVLSLDFGGLLPKEKHGCKYILVFVEYLTSWTLAKETKNATDDAVIGFGKSEIKLPFG